MGFGPWAHLFTLCNVDGPTRKYLVFKGMDDIHDQTIKWKGILILIWISFQPVSDSIVLPSKLNLYISKFRLALSWDALV